MEIVRRPILKCPLLASLVTILTLLPPSMSDVQSSTFSDVGNVMYITRFPSREMMG